MNPHFCPLSSIVGGRGSFKLEVVLTPSEELQHLQNQIRDLQAQVLNLKGELARVQNLYQYESIINLELLDACRENGVEVRSSLFQRRGLASP